MERNANTKNSQALPTDQGVSRLAVGRVRSTGRKLVVALLLLTASTATTAVTAASEIAYLGLAGSVWQCWVMDANGENARQVTRSTHDKMRVSWFPDGKRLLVNAANGAAYEVDLATGAEVRVPAELSGFQDAVVSPDGQKMAFSLSTSGSRDDNNIWIHDLRDSALRKLTGMPWLQHEPVWSPDGKEIFFLSGDGGQTHDIWRMPVNGGKANQLTANQAYHFDVSVAGDGTLAYSNNRDGSYDLWLRRPDGVEQRLTDHPALDARPSWSPDGRRLVFESTRDGGPDLWLLEIESGELIRLTHTQGSARAPVWYRGEGLQ